MPLEDLNITLRNQETFVDIIPQVSQMQKEPGIDTPLISANSIRDMATTNFKVGSFTVATGSQTPTVTGLTFKPKLVLLWASVSGCISEGFSDGTTSGNNGTRIDGIANQVNSDANPLHVQNASGEYVPSTVTMNADGFTLGTATNNTGGTVTVRYTAIG